MGMLLSDRARYILQTIRVVTAIGFTAIVIAIWTIPEMLRPWWIIASFVGAGAPGVIATFAIKADDDRRAKVR